MSPTSVCLSVVFFFPSFWIGWDFAFYPWDRTTLQPIQQNNTNVYKTASKLLLDPAVRTTHGRRFNPHTVCSKKKSSFFSLSSFLFFFLSIICMSSTLFRSVMFNPLSFDKKKERYNAATGAGKAQLVAVEDRFPLRGADRFNV